MNCLNLSDNLIRLRHEKRVTQEELAKFIGVTKASVSKWETRQSLPDLLLLPQLASFFDVSIDELIGYAPQLSKEQIQKIYYELAQEFANCSFEETMKKSNILVKKYYSCYPFLFQICVLWMNHFMLANDPKYQQEILSDVLKLCEHIIKQCKDINICNDTIILQSEVYLLMGQAEEVINTLEEVDNPYRLSRQSDSILIQAYQLCGMKEKATSHSQISMYLYLLALTNISVSYLDICKENLSICEEVIRRMDILCEAYQLDQLHPNTAAIFYLQAAVIYCIHHKEIKAVQKLERYVSVINWILADDNLSKHGDDYFDKIPDWYMGCALGCAAPRDKKIICESAVQGLKDPAFEYLKENKTFQKLKNVLEIQREKA